MSSADLLIDELLSLALHTCSLAADHVRDRRAELIGEGALAAAETKSSEVDPVTVVDKESEELIISTLQKHRPEDGILGEEGADIPSHSGVRWIVDPIDGTVNFLYGIPQYAVSIAAAHGDEVLAGVVVNVSTGRIYQACTGRGAFTRDRGDREWRRLGVSSASEVHLALVATGFSYTPQWRAQQADILRAVLPRVRDIRRAGSAALDLCMLADGMVDAYYEHATHPWDYAAGAVIAAEAGAQVVHPGLGASGHDGAVTMASGPGIWNNFRELLTEVGADKPLKPVSELR
nr:inositol monophosphatase [Streptococcus thermophilus]